MFTIMSGAAGLSAAKRRRGNQASAMQQSMEMQEENAILEQGPPMHPLQQLQVHDAKLNGLLAHIQELGKAFLEHRDEVALAIPQLQEAVEELLRAAQLDGNMQMIPEEKEEEVEEEVETELGSQAQRLMMSMTKELSDRLSAESEAKSRLEVKLEQVVRAHADTQVRLTGTEATVARLERELGETRKKTQRSKREPTFPDKSDADIVKEALANVGATNITLQATEEGEGA